MVLVLIPGGEFFMRALTPSAAAGWPDRPSTILIDPGAQPDERNCDGRLTEIALEPYFLAKYEMTQAQWLRVSLSNPSQSPPGTSHGGPVVTALHPVEQVGRAEARRALRRLALRLPTKARPASPRSTTGSICTPPWVSSAPTGSACMT
jgi:formylglycine-generating enzyme required for sulfatase activity